MEQPLRWNEQLKHERKQRNWSQAICAEKLGCDTKTIRRWEHAETVPDYQNRQRLKEVMGVSVQEPSDNSSPENAPKDQEMPPASPPLSDQAKEFLMEEGPFTPQPNQLNAAEPALTNEVYLHQEETNDVPDASMLYGRDSELAELEKWVLQDHCRLIAVVGVGGVGKSTLVSALMERVKQQFTFVFWHSLQNLLPPRELLLQLLQFISSQHPISVPEDSDRQIGLLVDYLRKHRCLLILDNFESVLQAGDLTGPYLPGYELYGKLLQRLGETQHQSCLIVTSRETPREVALQGGDSRPTRSWLLQGLKPEVGRYMLRDKHLRGSDADWELFVTTYSGNALALNIVAQFIHEVFDDKLSSFLQEGYLIFNEIEIVVEQQFKRLTALEQEILFWLAIEREATSLEQLFANILRPISRRNFQEAVQSLARRHLIEMNSLGLTLQNVIMEYVTNRFVDEVYTEIYAIKPVFFLNYSLIKAQAKTYIRETQIRSILTPIVEQLKQTMQAEEIEQKLRFILSNLHEKRSDAGYAAGNLLNLLIFAGYDLRGYDFSQLTIRQARLQNISLAEVNFSSAYFLDCSFTETFGSILSIAWSPNGEQFIVGTTNCEIRLWQASTGIPLRTFTGHTDWVRSVAFSKDGRMIVSASEDRSIRLWDSRSGKCLKVLEGHESRVDAIVFSPDGTLLASGSEDCKLRLWEVQSGKCLHILEVPEQWAWSVAFSPDGTLLASGGVEPAIRLWEVQSGKCLRIFYGHESDVRSVCFHPDGDILASGSDDQTIRVWKIDSGDCIKTLRGHDGRVWALSFSSDGKLLASGGEDRTVRVWDIADGRNRKTFDGHTNRVRSVAFHPDGKTLLSGGEDQSLRLWEISNGQSLKVLHGYTGWIYAVAFHPEGTLLASSGADEIISLWDIRRGKRITSIKGHTNMVRDIDFSPDGTKIVSVSDDHTIRFWGLDGECLNTLHGYNTWVRTIAFSPDGEFVAGGSEDALVRLWNVHTGKLIREFPGHTHRIWSVAFSPAGDILASGGEDHTIQLWSPQTGEHLKTLLGHDDQVRSLAFNSNGSLLVSGSEDFTLRLWEVSTGNCLKILRGHTGRLHSVAFSPDDALIASGSDDQTVRIWKLVNETCEILTGHSNRVRALAFQPSGKLLVSGSHDETLKIWDIHTAECLQTLHLPSLYEGMIMTNARGLTIAQKIMLKALGAIE